MVDTIQEPKKAMTESKELEQGCRRPQSWLMTEAKIRVVFPT